MNLDVPLDDATLIIEARAKMKREKKQEFVNPYHNMKLVPELRDPVVKKMHTVDLMTIAERQRNIAPLESGNRAAQKLFLETNDCQLAGVDYKSDEVVEWKNYRIANNLTFDCKKEEGKLTLSVFHENELVSKVMSSDPKKLIDLSLHDLRQSFSLPSEKLASRPRMRR
jgi:hypothetical protein